MGWESFRSLAEQYCGRNVSFQGFEFYVGKQLIKVSSVQTEVDAGYEGRNQIVLVEAKNFNTKNVIIRQLFYPFRQWQLQTQKKVITLFFDKAKDTETYFIWQFEFEDPLDYNSIKLVRSGKFCIKEEKK